MQLPVIFLFHSNFPAFFKKRVGFFLVRFFIHEKNEQYRTPHINNSGQNVKKCTIFVDSKKEKANLSLCSFLSSEESPDTIA